MSTTASSLVADTAFVDPPTPLPDHLRRRYLLLALGVLALLPAAACAFNVLHNPAYSPFSVYGFAALSFLAAAISQFVLLPSQGSFALRLRWYMWVGFLLLNAAGLALTAFDDAGLIHLPTSVRHIYPSLGYALAYIVAVNPPRSTAWRRLWLVDAVLACVMGIMFFLIYQYGEPAGVYTSLLFAVAIQVIFFLGSLLSLRTAESHEAQDLARCMLVYFLLRAVIGGMENLPHIWPRLSTDFAGDVLYALPTAGLALMPVLLHTRWMSRTAASPLHTRPLPPAAPVLITSAILLACLPLLHFNVIAGIALLVVAVGLFALKLALMQTDFDHERTSLLQNNKQLRELAYIDPVTGIANRRSFMETSSHALQTARSGLGTYWLLLFELEDLRRITAGSGRRASEQYLCDFVQLVHTTLDVSPTHFAHVANGEFALVLERGNQRTVETTLERLRDALRNAGTRVTTGAALAASSGPDTVERWLANAATNLHRNRLSEQTPPAL